jgi:hypothetical protein
MMFHDTCMYWNSNVLHLRFGDKDALTTFMFLPLQSATLLTGRRSTSFLT